MNIAIIIRYIKSNLFLKNIVKSILNPLYEILNHVILSGKKSKISHDKYLLLVRLDLIGDYLLFRNFIEFLSKSEKFRDHNIVLAGNISWKPIFDAFDKNFISKTIWIHRDRFSGNFFYRYKILKELTDLRYSIAINPSYSREYAFGDTIIRLVDAYEKIGCDGDLSNITQSQKNKSDLYYTELLKLNESLNFEFYRNKEIIEKVIGSKIPIKRPSLPVPNSRMQLGFKEYIVFFIGASKNKRKWPAEYFLSLGKILLKQNVSIVLCGAPDDSVDAEIIQNGLASESVQNLAGKTNLTDLMYVISKCSLIISNETSAVHMAAAYNKKCVVIYNGLHFGRFVPYPSEILKTYYPVYHPEIERNPKRYVKLTNVSEIELPDIRDITVDRVLQSVKQALN